MSGASDGEVAINTEGDIVVARRTVRILAVNLGFGLTDVTRIVTAASELARNVYKYGGGGVMLWRHLEGDGRPGIELQFIDHGPGIADVDLAMRQGHSTGKGLGLGLPAARRLMDEIDIQSSVGLGTRVTLKKWRTN